MALNQLSVSESGIPARVEATLDYGEEKFLKCAVGEKTAFVRADGEAVGEIYLLPDLEKMGIVETGMEIKII